MQAFHELSTDRPRQLSQAGQLVGPIPWTAMAAYADRLGLDEPNTEWFEAAVRALDTEYLLMEQDRLRTESSALALEQRLAAQRGRGGNG